MIARRALPLILLSASTASPALAVVTRDDVPDAAYRTHVGDFPSYCRLGLPDGGGTLIAPSYVLTAAHLAPIAPGHKITCGSEILTVATMTVHPAYDDGIGRHDLALIRLANPAKAKPVRLAMAPIAPGAVVELIGHYQGGTGLTGGVGRNPTGVRVATNRISAVDNHWIRFVMDSPRSGQATPLEGVSGGGDSGAPAFVMSGRDPVVIGVGSRGSDTNENGVEQDYGDTDLYVPVASYADWIDRVTNGREGPIRNWIDGQADRPWLPSLIAAMVVMLAATVLWRLRRS